MGTYFSTATNETLLEKSFNYEESDSLGLKDCPLFFKTQRPVIYGTFHFGGHDFLAYIEKFIDENNAYFTELKELKLRYINRNYESIKDIETEYKNMIDKICEETIRLNSNNSEFVENLKLYREKVNFNRNSRMKIIDALGGFNNCSNIHIYEFAKNAEVQEYINFTVGQFPEGINIMQFEDYTGRKGVTFKLKNKKNGIYEVLVCHQRYRETAITNCFSGGELWCLNSMFDLNDISKFIESVLNNTNDQYEL